MNDNGKNTIQILENGPVYFRGNIEVLNADGDVVMEKSRVAMCRCGNSSSKPACDGTHKKIDFHASANADLSSIPATGAEHSEKLVVRTVKDGPILVKGLYTLTSPDIGEHTSSKNIALCRCGASSNKPFCDGTHKSIPFKGS